MTIQPSGRQHTKRDADILQMLGIFLVVLAVPVLIGTFWAEGAFERTINILAGLIIGIIGAGMILRGRWTGRNLD